MKKLLMPVLSAIVAVTLVTPRAKAQDIKVGAKLGFNLAKVDIGIVGAPNTESRFGVTIGAAVDIPLADAISLQTGIQYAMKGTEFENDPDSISVDLIEIPALVKYDLAGGKAYAAAGLNIGIISSAEMETTPVDIDVKNRMPGMNLDLVIGGGGALLDGKLSIGVQYELGLTDLNDNPSAWGGAGSFKSRNLQIVVGYTF